MLPIILGAAAVIIVAALYFSGERDNPNPVTGRDAPGTTQAPAK
jgi:hypothetical protein